MNPIKKHKWKVCNILLVVTGSAVYLYVELYWQSVCLGGRCNVSFMEGALSSVQYASLFLSIIFALFLFLPTAYFKRYLTVWFWWLFILGYSIAAATAPVGGSILAFNRSQAVLILSGLGFLQAVYFVYSFHKKKKMTQSEVK
jgi:hypothetical protein